MSAATINLRIRPFRLLTKAETANYCRLPIKTFEALCPVAPIIMANGDRLWDVRDLDHWIDSLKSQPGDDPDEIVKRLE
jgi:hypothetical protein